MSRSCFITVEGVEGAGKSSICQFLEDYLKANEVRFIKTREPGGTELAEKIRAILLAPHQEQLFPKTELLLMFAARVQHIETVIKPALARGDWVLSDRFTDASFAYQGGGRQLDLDIIEQLASWIQQDLQPDLTLLLDVPVELGLSRIQSRGGAKDRIEREGKEFFERVRAQYLQLAQRFPKRYRVIDASKPVLEVVQAVEAVILPLLETAA